MATAQSSHKRSLQSWGELYTGVTGHSERAPPVVNGPVFVRLLSSSPPSRPAWRRKRSTGIARGVREGLWSVRERAPARRARVGFRRDNHRSRPTSLTRIIHELRILRRATPPHPVPLTRSPGGGEASKWLPLLGEGEGRGEGARVFTDNPR